MNFSLLSLTLKQSVVDGTLMIFNVAAWTATIVSWDNVNQTSSVLSTLAATAVSVATVFWIRAQAKALVRAEAMRAERNRRQEAAWEEAHRQGVVLDESAVIIKKIPEMQQSMAEEHVLNVGIRDLAKETLKRSVSLPDQAIEKDKVTASRTEVRRVGKVVDKTAAGEVTKQPARPVSKKLPKKV